MKLDYKDSGVNIQEGNELVENLKEVVKKTFNNQVIGGIGSFSGAYAMPSGYKEPVMLAATDGVGTKLKLAIQANKLNTIGIDLVAMCVNDLICNFAEPLFFLDYYATGKLDKNRALEVIKGIASGCMEAECALIGGESAEMPGMYSDNDFDLAGFAVGVAEREIVERENNLKSGDVVIALSSSGIHSNGYSLVRKIIETNNIDIYSKFGDSTLIDSLLTPTKIYVKTFKKISKNIKALAHITGGGLVENIPRILPKNLDCYIFEKGIQKLPIFKFLEQYIKDDDKYRTFNMGVGMVLVCSKENVDSVLKDSGGYILGEIKEGSSRVAFV